MKSLRVLSAVLLAAAVGACEAAPTGVVEPGPSRSAATDPLGEIYYSVNQLSWEYWEINFSTQRDARIQSRQWSQLGGVDQSPWGNGAYKYVVHRSGPGCVVAKLETTFTAGGSRTDVQEVRLGGYTGVCLSTDL